MDPVTLSVLGIAAGWVLDRAKDSPGGLFGPGGKTELPEPPEFAPGQVDMFAHVENNVRTFDKEIAARIPEYLSSRTVVQVDGGPLGRMGSVWKVVPLSENGVLASNLVKNSHMAGAVVLGSLSLVLLPTGRDVPMLIVVGGKGSEVLAGQGGHFAILPPPITKPTAVKPPPERVEKPAVKNGAAKVHATEIVVEAESVVEKGP